MIATDAAFCSNHLGHCWHLCRGYPTEDYVCCWCETRGWKTHGPHMPRIESMHTIKKTEESGRGGKP
jgi:hypothetical protein